MAQLVKLQDYVSRYEKNLYHYQSLFTRIKEKRLKDFLSKQSESNLNSEQKRKEFRKSLFKHQFNWATSTVREISNVKTAYERDLTLRFLTEETPDNYFLFYEPVLQMKNAPVELDCLLIGPAQVWLIVWMGKEGVWQEADNKRFWKNIDTKETMLNPIIRIDRMYTVISEWLEPYNQQLTVKKTIVAKDGYLDFEADWRKITYIDKRNFKDWHKQVVHEPAPVKSQQLKFVSTILEHSVTNSLYRKDPLSNESEISFEGI